MSIVEIDGVKYEPVMLGGRRQIIICQRRFIYVGIVEDGGDGDGDGDGGNA